MWSSSRCAASFHSSNCACAWGRLSTAQRITLRPRSVNSSTPKPPKPMTVIGRYHLRIGSSVSARIEIESNLNITFSNLWMQEQWKSYSLRHVSTVTFEYFLHWASDIPAFSAALHYFPIERGFLIATDSRANQSV